MRFARAVIVAMLVTVAAWLLVSGPIEASSRRAGSVSATFSFPASGVISYATERGWDVHWEIHGSAARQRLIESIARTDPNGGCHTAKYARRVPQEDVVAPVHLAGRANYCHRYRLQLLDDRGSLLATAVSGSLRIVSNWAGKKDVYRSGAFSTQRTTTWCVGASVQIMLNMILGQRDHSFGGQLAYMRYARSHDRETGLLGTNALGWKAALNHYAGGNGYHVRVDRTLKRAIHDAARRVRMTGHPVGLLVMRGRHAWVMSGFEATADPAMTNHFKVTAVYVEGPLYPFGQANGFDMPPDTRITVSYLRSFMRPYEAPGTTWDQRFVTVRP
jgi:hypothetical protein